ncbi:MFS transporter [Leekyejoonella antrihumi]|uniref:MFS transporter n=1 Tax=Leekyejoonella antrihumi TaxID=1660198 RepID=UPI001FE478BF|nr:MFS transporter [Leekyejoonella antrihumi]
MNDPAPSRAGTREWLGLALLCLAVLLIAVDSTVLDIALPFISESLRPSGTQLLWIVDVYSFVISGLLVTMGSVGDRIGRRRLLMMGAAGFGLASVLAAFSTDPLVLIGARILQGVTGATLMPSTLGLIRSNFQDARQRGTAIGVWGAMWGGGSAAGPVLGGWLLEHFWWGSVFLINVPIMIVLVALAPKVIRESRDPNPARFDLISAGLSMAAVIPVVFAIKEAAVHGISWPLVVVAVVGVLAGWAFVRRQNSSPDPLLDLQLFHRPVFATAIATNLLSVLALAGVLFFGAQYLQLVLGFSPLPAGLLMLPGTLASMIGSLLSAPLARRWGPRLALAVPLTVAGVGAAMLIAVGTGGGAVVYLVGFMLMGLGTGTALTVTSSVVVEAVNPARAASASALSETAMEFGAATGVALLGSAGMAVYRHGLETSGLSGAQAQTAQASIGGAAEVARVLGARADQLLGSAHQAFVDGLHLAAALTAILLLVTTVLVWATLHPRRLHSDETPAGPRKT